MTRRYRKTPKMELYRRRAPDYTELAYREAVAKLKYLLAESYTPVSINKPSSSLMQPEKENMSESSVYPLEYKRPLIGSDPSPFFRRQEEYIEQLEKEGQMYREELSRMLDKVRQVVGKQVSEDESEKELKETGRRARGPSIVYSSRISELEAHLTQCKLELRKAQDEASYLKAHSKPIQPPVSQQTVQQLESLQRERDDLNERVSSLQAMVGQLRDKEASATQKVKRSLDVVDQAQFDKNQLEMEVRRLKSELDRMSDKQREALQESARRVSEAERRYAMQIERLNGDLAAQWDAANRLNLELDRARRTEGELKRELAQKAAVIDELKKELTTKTGNLQNEALSATEERERLENELTACRLTVERAERQSRQDVAKLQAEVQALRSRLDRADQDLLSSRKENIRLSDVIASLEKELSLSKLTKDSATSKESKRADELKSMIKEIDAKHEESVSELEGLIQSQTQLMEKLNAECQTLTKRLEESSARHKEEMANLQNNIDYLSSKIEAPDHFRNQEWRDDEKLGKYKEPEGTRNQEINKVEKSHLDSIVASSYPEVSNNDLKGTEPKINELTHDKEKPTDYKETAEKYKEETYRKDNTKSQEEALDPTRNTFEQQKDLSSYEQVQGYDPTQQGYDMGYGPPQPEGYEQGQYDQTDNQQYDPNQGYDQTGEFGDQVYQHGQTYEEGGAIYEQNQPYNQGDEFSQQQAYDQGHAYDQTGAYPQGEEYPQGDQTGYSQGEGYPQGDQTGAYSQGEEYPQGDQTGYSQGEEYPQGDQTGYSQGGEYPQGDQTGAYPQGEGYPQGEVYTGAGEVYNPEGYDQTISGETYKEQPYEEGYQYQQDKTAT